MNVKLKGFGCHADLCIKGHFFRVYSNIWCELVDNEIKLSYSNLRVSLVSDYVYHTEGDAVCFWHERSRRTWGTTLESMYVDRLVSLLIHLKDKSDYEIFCEVVEKQNCLLHSSVFKFVRIIREKDFKFKICDSCSTLKRVICN